MSGTPVYRNESALVGGIWKAIVRAHPDAWLLKVHGGPYQRAGVPDLVLTVAGLFIGLEVKHQKPGESADGARERTTPLQRAEIRKINAAGGWACTVISVDEALTAIERAIERARVRADGTRDHE
jgi:hypothetical protein